MNGEVLLRIKAVKEKTGLKHATLYKLIEQGKFPRPVTIAERCSAWLLSEVEVFIQSRIAASQMPNQDHDQRRLNPDRLQRHGSGSSQKETQAGRTELYFEYGRVVTRQHLFHLDEARALSLKSFLQACTPDGAAAWRLTTE